MDTLPDLDTFDIFRAAAVHPDIDRIEAVLRRSEKIALGLTEKFPHNAVFADHLDTTRRAFALIPDARAALERDDRHRLEEIAAELAGLFTARGKADQLTEWGLLPG